MYSITVCSRRLSAARLEREHPGADIIDVTSKGAEPWVRFSPFYPIGGIPVPGWEARTSACVEGIWQGLKVFESADIDEASFDNASMRGLKRTVRKHGRVLGHRFGPAGELLSYVDARRRIYLPAYHWVLEHKLAEEVERLRELLARQPVVLLDYETNGNVEDTSKPLSHASIVAAWLGGT